MKTIIGKYASAKIFAEDIEDYASAQIQMHCDNSVFSGCKIRIMPDVHPAHVVTVGFTTTANEKIMPNIVGSDIGCGIAMAKVNKKKAEYQKLDSVIHETALIGIFVSI